MTIIKSRSTAIRNAVFVCLFGIVALLTACVDSSYSVSGISNGKRYVGLYDDADAPNQGSHPKMPEKIVINYGSNPLSLPVYLNGQPVGDKFTYGSSSAELAVSDVKELLKQGSNLLLVDPLAFGPNITFIFDNRGPMVDVMDVEDIGGAYSVTVRAADTVNVSNVTLERVNYQWDGGTDNTQYTPFKKELVSDTGEITALVQNEEGTWTTSSSITPAAMYAVSAEDDYGFVTRDYYLAPDQKLNNVFKLKLEKSVLDAMVPMIEPQIRQMHVYSAQAMDDYSRSYPSDPEAIESKILDSMNEWWSSSAIFYADMGASTTNQSDCGYVDSNVVLTSSNFTCTNIKTDAKNGNKYCRRADMKPNASRTDAKQGSCSRIVLWRLELDDVQDMSFTLRDTQRGMLELDMELQKDAKSKALYTDLGIRNIKCENRYSTSSRCKGSYSIGVCWGGTEDGISVNASGAPTETLTHAAYARDGSGTAFCRDDGAVSYLGANLGAMEVTADSANPNGGIKVLIKDGALDLAFDNVKLNLSGTAIGGSMSSFYSWAIGLMEGVLDGLFVGIVESTLQQNMQDFKLGFDLFLENDSQDPPDPSMRMLSEAYQVWTNADNNAATEVEWYMYYSGFLKAVKQHPEVPLVLGSRYTTNEVLHPVDSGSQIDMSINVNIINQALMSMYRSGITHITVTNLKTDGKSLVHFGPSVSDSYPAQSGDTRVELVPQTPGMFEMRNGTTGTQATLYYRNAQMNIETYRSGTWERDFEVAVDIRAGVLMKAVDGKFQMTILGTPDLTINAINTLNGPSYLPDSVLKKLVQFGVDMVMNVAIPQIAETYTEIALPAIPGIEGSNQEIIMVTDKIEANNNAHLSFGIGLSVQEVTP